MFVVVRRDNIKWVLFIRSIGIFLCVNLHFLMIMIILSYIYEYFVYTRSMCTYSMGVTVNLWGALPGLRGFIHPLGCYSPDVGRPTSMLTRRPNDGFPPTNNTLNV